MTFGLSSLTLNLDLGPTILLIRLPRSFLLEISNDLCYFRLAGSRCSCGCHRKILTTKSACMFSFHHKLDVLFATPPWKNFVTNKYRIFTWLEGKQRLFTNLRHFCRGLATDACMPTLLSESLEHLFLHCKSIQPFWNVVLLLKMTLLFALSFKI